MSSQPPSSASRSRRCSRPVSTTPFMTSWPGWGPHQPWGHSCARQALLSETSCRPRPPRPFRGRHGGSPRAHGPSPRPIEPVNGLSWRRCRLTTREPAFRGLVRRRPLSQLLRAENVQRSLSLSPLDSPSSPNLSFNVRRTVARAAQSTVWRTMYTPRSWTTPPRLAVSIPALPGSSSSSFRRR